ncbi:uncharacterized protein [Onthophagus taurus]|uniref:uncharacterized protein n=1 Tax=Onthophagus taurus TaxID=166361 RepID=UPI0039BE979B
MMSLTLKNYIFSAFIFVICLIAAIHGDEDTSTNDETITKNDKSSESEEQQRMLNNIVEGAVNLAKSVSKAANTAKGVADMVKNVLGNQSGDDDSDEKSPLEMMGPLISLLSQQ